MGLSNLLLVTGAIAAISSCDTNLEVIEASGPAVDRNIEVSEFTELTVAGPFDVTVSDGAPGALAVSGPENILDNMEFEVEGDELTIRMKRGISTRMRGETVTVAFSHNGLREANIAGSGMIDIARVTNDFEGAIAGSGDLRVREMAVERADFNIAGSGDIRAVGTADQIDVSIAGSGEFISRQLVSRTADISIAGSGDVDTQVTGTADVSIIGSGDVLITGGAECTVSKAGSGDVRCS